MYYDSKQEQVILIPIVSHRGDVHLEMNNNKEDIEIKLKYLHDEEDIMFTITKEMIASQEFKTDPIGIFSGKLTFMI